MSCSENTIADAADPLESLDDAMAAGEAVAADPGGQAIFPFAKPGGMFTYDHFYDDLKMVK